MPNTWPNLKVKDDPEEVTHNRENLAANINSIIMRHFVTLIFSFENENKYKCKTCTKFIDPSSMHIFISSTIIK